jgi:hypothetical protein
MHCCLTIAIYLDGLSCVKAGLHYYTGLCLDGLSSVKAGLHYYTGLYLDGLSCVKAGLHYSNFCDHIRITCTGDFAQVNSG